jgi:hypothetical protein
MSILAQFYQIAPPGIQKRVVIWIGAFVLIFTLFTVFVGRTATHLAMYANIMLSQQFSNVFQCALRGTLKTFQGFVVVLVPWHAHGLKDRRDVGT